MLEPVVLDLVGHVLGSAFKLSSLNARGANPGGEAQPLHVDVGAIADERGFGSPTPSSCSTTSLRTTARCAPCPAPTVWESRPPDVLADPKAPHPDEVLVTGRAGDVVVMNAHLWHAGTANRTRDRRLALHSFYCRADKPQQQYQRRLLRPETQSRLSARARTLLALDDPRNDALSAAGEGESGFLPRRGPTAPTT